MKVTKKWYEENRELYTNVNSGERYYDLPLNSIMEIVHDKEAEDSFEYSWKSRVIEMNAPWVVVELTILRNGEELGSWLGSSANNTSGDVSPIVLAQNQALKSFFKRVYNECNLPKELTIVDEEQKVSAIPEEIELPDVPVPEVKTEEPEIKEEVKEKPAKKAVKKAVKKEEKVEEETKDSNELDEALKTVIKVGSVLYDGKTIEDVLTMPGSDVFLKHFASRVDNEKYAVYKDFCKSAKVVVEAKNL